MKKNILITIVFFLIIILGGCAKDENRKIYGKYKFDKIIYECFASSSTPRYLNEKLKGTKYIIKKDRFEIITSEESFKISNPTYKKEEMNEELIKKFEHAVDGLVSIAQYKEKYQYSICQNDNIVIYYLFSLDDELWIASYINPQIPRIVRVK